MATKKLLGMFLSVAMAVPSGAVTTTTTTGTVRGVVSMAGHGLDGLPLTLVNVETGKSFTIRSGADGSFSAILPAGSYVFSSPGRAGVSISRAPLSVDVFSGKVVSADVEITSFGMQDPAGPAGTAKINHDFVDCITEGEFTLIEAIFEPLTAVVNGRLYFQSNLSPEWFYTEFEKIDPQVPGGPTHRAFIPKVNQEGGIETINYYLQVTSSDFAETKSDEHTAKVVEGGSECDGKMAPIGNPTGAVSVLSASGASAGALAGFGGVAGAGIGAAALVGIGAGVIAGGVAVQQATKDEATPTPTATVPPSTPTPTATPTATPTQFCRLLVVTDPAVAADPSIGGRFCTANVVADGTTVGTADGSASFNLPCTANVQVFANVAPISSIGETLPATWGQACGGSALGVPCVLNPLTSDRTVSLTCSTR